MRISAWISDVCSSDLPRERAVDRVERATDGGGCAAPRVGQRHAAFLAMEQRYAEPFFQQLDLITDRSLRHPEFGGGGGEVFVPRGGFEDADGGEIGRASCRERVCQYV